MSVRRLSLSVAFIVIGVVAGVVVAQITGTYGPGGTIDSFGSHPYHHDATQASVTGGGIAGGLAAVVVLVLGRLVCTNSASRLNRAIGLTLLAFVTVVLVLGWVFPPYYLGTAHIGSVPLA